MADTNSTYKYGEQVKDANGNVIGTAKYNDKTGALLTPDPVPPAPPVAPPDTTRYSRVPSPYDSRITDLNTKLDSTVGEAPDLAKITADKKTAAQSMIDAVNSEFARILDEQTTTNDTNNARVRASNVSSGLAGGDFATSKAIDQETKNKKAIDLINSEKQAKIQAILADVDSRASEAYRVAREDYVKSLGDQLDRVKAAKDEDRAKALGSITAFAQQKIPLEKVKSSDPQTYQTLLSEYGGSELDLEAAWNDALPADMKVQYQDKIIQGNNGDATLFRYGLNPLTGTVEQKEYPLGVSFNSLNGVKPVNVNGRLFALSTDKNGDEIARPLTEVTKKTTSGASPKGTVHSGSATFLPEQLTAVSKELEKSKTLYGGDGVYVNPEIYQQAYDAWTSTGGLAKDFLTQYPPSKYVNPKNNTLPEYLRSANKTSPSSKSTSGRSL